MNNRGAKAIVNGREGEYKRNVRTRVTACTRKLTNDNKEEQYILYRFY